MDRGLLNLSYGPSAQRLDKHSGRQFIKKMKETRPDPNRGGSIAMIEEVQGRLTVVRSPAVSHGVLASIE